MSVDIKCPAIATRAPDRPFTFFPRSASPRCGSGGGDDDGDDDDDDKGNDEEDDKEEEDAQRYRGRVGLSETGVEYSMKGPRRPSTRVVSTQKTLGLRRVFDQSMSGVTSIR